jgi:hypothetical protein
MRLTCGKNWCVRLQSVSIAGESVHHKCINSRTAFNLSFWNTALVELFISLGIGCEVRGALGATPLHVASSSEMVTAACDSIAAFD